MSGLVNDGRSWRTNIGLRLTPELGTWFEARCKAENRTYANYIETLIIRDRATGNARDDESDGDDYADRAEWNARR